MTCFFEITASNNWLLIYFPPQELERKKGKKPQEAPKLSKKQEEQLAAQKQKESEIRNKLRVVSSCPGLVHDL